MMSSLAVAMLAMAAMPSVTLASDDTVSYSDLAAEIRAMREAMAAQEARHDAEIAAIREEQGETWMTEERAAEVRSIVTDVLADSSMRTNWQGDSATAGWDAKRGFFLSSADGNFLLKFSGQMQWRYAYQSTSGNDDDSHANGFSLGHAKVKIAGHVFDPTWLYQVQAAFDKSNGQLKLEDTWIRKSLGNGMNVTLGQWKDRGVYEEFTSDTKQQFVDRSIVTRYFTTKRVMGIAWDYRNDAINAYASFNDGGNSANTTITSKPCDWAVSGRIDWLAAGSWKSMDEIMSFRGSDFALMFGGALHYEVARGYDTSGADDAYANNLSWVVDANLRGNGWSGLVSYYGNQSDFVDGDTASATGILAQAGYFVTDNLELVANWQWVDVDGDNAPDVSNGTFDTQRFWITTFGANYYVDGNRVKLQLDCGWSNGPILFSKGVYGDGISGAEWATDDDGQTEVVLRAGVQLLF